MQLFASLIAKGQPGPGAVHFKTALGNERSRRRGFPQIMGGVVRPTLDAETSKKWSVPFEVKKADPDRHLIFGWASVTTKGGERVIDKQHDIVDTQALEEAAYEFVLYSRDMGKMHEQRGVGRLVESMMFTTEKQAALGIDLGMEGWFIGFRVDDAATWADIKAGALPEFSIGGQALSEPA